MKKKGYFMLGALSLVFVAFVLGYFFGHNYHSADYTLTFDRQPAVQTARPTADVQTEGKIDLNTATVEELCGLHGVGEALAERIVAYRQAHGGFRSTDELINVSGIGTATYENLEPYVTVADAG